jgi:hypothetical protein
MINGFKIIPPESIFPPDLKAAVDELIWTRRRKVYSVAGEYVRDFVRKYLYRIAPQNHKTAESFDPPAKPTGHLEKAARNTVVVAGPDSALVVVTSPGITRAFGELNIVAKGKMLTIPARTAPEAYGHTAEQVRAREPLFFVKSKSGGGFLATGDESKKSISGRGLRPPRPQRVRPRKPDRKYPTAGISGIRPVFWLRASVKIPQKRNILPSDAAILGASVRGVDMGVKSIFRKHGVPLK